MIVSLLVRKGLSVADAVKVFAKVRSPGIYKDDYLEKMFLYNHERE
jgi:mRNA-capping enzyme